MQENQILILQEAQALVSDMLRNKLSKNIKFHTLQHTQEVVAACQLLADFLHIENNDRFALLLAAWFHDTGYTSGNGTGHEAVSIRMADEFMSSRSISEEIKNKVKGCIEATKMPQTPDGILQQIICDADLFHLGTDAFDEKNRLLRKELNEFGDNDVSKKDWKKINIRFLGRHEYFTEYGRQKLQPVKDRHLADLLEKDDKKNENMKPEKKEKEKKKRRLTGVLPLCSASWRKTIRRSARWPIQKPIS